MSPIGDGEKLSWQWYDSPRFNRFDYWETDMLKGYKTMIVNAAVILMMAIKMISPDAELPDAADVGGLVDSADELIGKAEALYIAALATANMVLRAVTTSPMFNKGD